MITQTVITATLLCGTSVLAEGRDDPFLRCSFDDGRVVVLAERGDEIEWREGDFVGSVIPADRADDTDAVFTYFGPWMQPEQIDVFRGWQGDSGPDVDAGTAYLSRNIMNDDGVFLTESTHGLCEAYSG